MDKNILIRVADRRSRSFSKKSIFYQSLDQKCIKI